MFFFVDIQLRYREKRDHRLVNICLTIHGLDCVNVKCNIRVKCLLFILILEKPLKKNLLYKSTKHRSTKTYIY